MEGLKGTQVDSVSYCAFLDLANWEFPSGNTRALGPDPLKHVVGFCHANQMEFLYSMRMNDVHAAVYPGEKYWSSFKLENLDLLQARLSQETFDQDFLPWIQKKKPEHPLEDLLEYWGYTEGGRHIDQFRNSALGPRAFSWPAFDFAHAEVRKRYLGVIDEACRRYDLDGFEMDRGTSSPDLPLRRGAPEHADHERLHSSDSPAAAGLRKETGVDRFYSPPVFPTLQSSHGRSAWTPRPGWERDGSTCSSPVLGALPSPTR